MNRRYTRDETSRRALPVAAILVVGLLCLTLTQCLGRHSVTALYNTNTCPPRSITVLPIQDPSLSADAVDKLTERVAESMRRMYPGVFVRVDKSVTGATEEKLLDYARNNIHSSYFVYGNVWSPRYDNWNSEVELLARSLGDGKEVWSIASRVRVKDAGDSEWEDAVGEAVDVILAKLPAN